MNVWLVILAVGACSYLFRVSMLVVAARHDIPPAVGTIARFTVPATFTALVATSLAHQASTDIGSVAPSVALLTAVIAVRRTGSPRAALLAGMPTLWLLSALTG